MPPPARSRAAATIALLFTAAWGAWRFSRPDLVFGISTDALIVIVGQLAGVAGIHNGPRHPLVLLLALAVTVGAAVGSADRRRAWLLGRMEQWRLTTGRTAGQGTVEGFLREPNVLGVVTLATAQEGRVVLRSGEYVLVVPR